MIVAILALAASGCAGCTGLPSVEAPEVTQVGAAPGAAWMPADSVVVDPQRLLADLQWLADDARGGRGTGSPGAEAARTYLVEAFEAMELQAFDGGFLRPFAFRGAPDGGVNVLGFVPGRDPEAGAILVTAHYDHLGTRDGMVYNGADDNASGTAGLLALARHFVRHPGRHTMVFAALDAEEHGLLGARALVADPPLPLERIVMNVNLDMVSRSPENELWAVGIHAYPALADLLAPVAEASGIRLRFGHDGPGLGRDDWTNASDHAVFHRQGIPFVYFGVEDHEAYHKPTDDADEITPAFFVEAVRTIGAALLRLDASLHGRLPARTDG